MPEQDTATPGQAAELEAVDTQELLAHALHDAYWQSPDVEGVPAWAQRSTAARDGWLAVARVVKGIADDEAEDRNHYAAALDAIRALPDSATLDDARLRADVAREVGA